MAAAAPAAGGTFAHGFRDSLRPNYGKCGSRPRERRMAEDPAHCSIGSAKRRTRSKTGSMKRGKRAECIYADECPRCTANVDVSGPDASGATAAGVGESERTRWPHPRSSEPEVARKNVLAIEASAAAPVRTTAMLATMRALERVRLESEPTRPDIFSGTPARRGAFPATTPTEVPPGRGAFRRRRPIGGRTVRGLGRPLPQLSEVRNGPSFG
jgi:hypothetical protein